MNEPRITIKRVGKQWAIFEGDTLIEGGFFSRVAAESAKEQTLEDLERDPK